MNRILNVILLWIICLGVTIFADAGSGVIDQIKEKGQLIIDLSQYKWNSKTCGKDGFVEMNHNFDEVTPDGNKALTMKINTGKSWLRGLVLKKGAWRKHKFSSVSFWIKSKGAGGLGFIYFYTGETEIAPWYIYSFVLIDRKWQKMTVPFEKLWQRDKKRFDFSRVKQIQFRFNAIAPAEVAIGPLVIQADANEISLAPVKKIEIYPASQAPVIDGKINDSCWESATHLDDFVLIKTMKDKPEEKTEVWLTYDEKNLYIAARLHSADTGKLKAEMKNRDDPVWQDDSFEVFFDVLNDYTCWHQFIVNSIGTQEDIRRWWDKVAVCILAQPRWNGKWQAKVKVKPKMWDVEMAIPFSDLENIPAPGKYIGLQLARENHTLNEYSSWSPTDRFPKSQNFGLLCFCTKEKKNIEIKNIRLLQGIEGDNFIIKGDFISKVDCDVNIEAIITDSYQRKHTFSKSIKASKGPNEFMIRASYTGQTEGPHKLAVVASCAGETCKDVVLVGYNLIIPSPIKYGDIVFCPIPKEVKWSKERFSFTPKYNIYIRKNPTEKEKYTAKYLKEEIYGYFGKDLSILEAPGNLAGMIVISKNPKWEQVKKDKLLTDIDRLTPEGYVLKVGSNEIIVKGKDAAGLYYGVTTLCQLMRSVRVREEKNLPGVEIVDWPDLKIRFAVSWFITVYGRMTNDFKYEYFKKYIQRVLAGSKINHFIFICENGIVYETPENKKLIHGPLMTMEEYKQFVAFCRKNFIEFIPGLNSGSHSSWLTHGGHRELQEGKDYSQVDVLHPEYYKILFPVFDELIKAIKPKYFYIGQDEWWHRGKVRAMRDGIPRKEIFLNHLLKLHDHLAQKNVKTIMWCDMLLRDHNGGPPLNIADVAKRLPKDILMINWSYGVSTDPVGEMKKYGFDVIDGVINFHPIPSKDKSRIIGYGHYFAGKISTASHISDERQYSSCFLQVLRAADYAWNVNHHNDLPIAEWMRLYGKNIVAMTSIKYNPQAGDKFIIVDLGPYANANYLTNGPSGFALSGLILGEQKIGFIPMKIIDPDTNQNKSCIIMEEKGREILVGKKLSSLIFLHTSILPQEKKKDFQRKTSKKYTYGPKIGKYQVNYIDGKNQVIDIRYGLNVNNWIPYPPARFMYETRYVLERKTKDGKLCCAYQYEWVNPYPDKEIKSITAISLGTEATPVLLAITGRSVKNSCFHRRHPK